MSTTKKTINIRKRIAYRIKYPVWADIRSIRKQICDNRVVRALLPRKFMIF